MENLHELSGYELAKRLRQAREELAAAPNLPLEEGFIFQSDRDHLQKYWQGQVKVYEAETSRRAIRENAWLIAGGIVLVLWVLSMVIAGFTDSWKVFTGILYGGIGLAILIWGFMWLASKERWWNQK